MKNATIDTQLFMRVPVRCEKSGADGTIVLRDIQAIPLKLDDWFAFSEIGDLKIKIFGTVADKPAWENTYPPIGNRFKAEFTITQTLGNSCFALVKGGWLPLIYTFSKGNIIADRNIISEIKARFSNGEVSQGRRCDDFIDYMSNENCSCIIHTISYALESNQRKLPSVEKIQEQHRAAIDTISKSLPHIKTWPEFDSDLRCLTELIDKFREYFNEGVKLLTKLAPLVVSSPSRGNRVGKWRGMAQIALSENVSTYHIAFLACLSASTANQSFNPARKLIKPKDSYTEDDAYNAMYDLFLIMLSNVLQTQGPEHKVALVTRDKNLALFWMGLTFADSSIPGQQVIGLHELLLPVSSEELDELTSILGRERISKAYPNPSSVRF